MGGINYLFPPDQIEALPTWRFVVYFLAPEGFQEATLPQIIARLQEVPWQVVTFPFGLENLAYDAENNAVSVPIEVPETARRQPNGMAEYESDFWKLAGNMAEFKFEEIYYEAIDWQEE